MVGSICWFVSIGDITGPLSTSGRAFVEPLSNASNTAASVSYVSEDKKSLPSSFATLQFTCTAWVIEKLSLT